jgi:hypothetical protein
VVKGEEGSEGGKRTVGKVAFLMRFFSCRIRGCE